LHAVGVLILDPARTRAGKGIRKIEPLRGGAVVEGIGGSFARQILALCGDGAGLVITGQLNF